MKRFYLGFTMTLFTHLLLAQPYHFRHTRWGFSRRQVVESEQQKPKHISGSNLTYNPVLVSGYSMELSYEFTNDFLYSASYTVNAPISDSTQIKGVFLNIVREAFIDFGEPTKIEGNESDPVKKLEFQTKTNRAVIFFGRTDDRDYKLFAYYMKPKTLKNKSK